MVTAIIHGFILAIGLILPLGAQNVFIFNQGANQPKYRYVLPAIIAAGLSDSLLIIIAVVRSIYHYYVFTCTSSNYLYSWFNFLDVYGLDHLA